MSLKYMQNTQNLPNWGSKNSQQENGNYKKLEYKADHNTKIKEYVFAKLKLHTNFKRSLL